MRYFTPDLYVKLQSTDENEANRADAAWERAVSAYGRRLKKIRPYLPRPLCTLLDDYSLHDAHVLNLAQQEDTFIILLRLEPPPKDLMVLVYSLRERPSINKDAFPEPYRSRDVQWLYDEVNYLPRSNTFSHKIMLCNGWVLEIVFDKIQVIAAHGLLPESRSDDSEPHCVFQTA